MNNKIRVTALVLVAFMSAECTDRADTKKAELPAASSVRQPAAVQTEDRSGCPATGVWAVCSVEKRLKQSGFVALKNDSVLPRRAGFSVKPEVYTLNRSRLELYFYRDAATLNSEMLKVDTSAAAPVFIRAGNLAALLFTDDARQAERLSLALTAGAPGAR